MQNASIENLDAIGDELELGQGATELLLGLGLAAPAAAVSLVAFAARRPFEMCIRDSPKA